MTRVQRALLPVAAAAIAVAGCGSSGKTVSQATIAIVHGPPAGGVKTVRFKQGGTVDLIVRSDTPGEVHFHGYDVMRVVPKGGGTVEFRFPAKIEGKFEVELEQTKTQIASVEVVP